MPPPGRDDTKLAVNLSPAQFKTQDIYGLVRRVLSETGLAPQRLELEITEGIILQNTDAVLDTLTRLDQLGVSIAMDDFGTGYSSLSYLTRFPVKKIKIDRSFIDTLGTSPQTSAIVSSIVGLGQSLQRDHHRRGRGDGRPGRDAEEMGLRPSAGLLLRQARRRRAGIRRSDRRLSEGRLALAQVATRPGADADQSMP